MSLYALAVAAERAAKIARDNADHAAGVESLRKQRDELLAENTRLSESCRDFAAQGETDAAIIKEDGREIHFLRTQRDELLSALKEIRDDFDCDSDAHKYGTTCRCCLAKKAIASVKGQQ